MNFMKVLSLIEKGNDQKVQLILKNNCGELLYVVDASKATLLHYSTEYSNKNVVQYLLNQGCNVNAKELAGNTPLMISVKQKNKEIIQILLEAGADMLILNNENRSALQMACEEKYFTPEIGELFFSKLYKKYPTSRERAQKFINAGCYLHEAICLGDVKLVKIMLKNGLSAYSIHPISKQTILHTSVVVQNVDIVKLLLKYGKIEDNNVNNTSRRGSSLIKKQNNETAKLFLENHLPQLFTTQSSKYADTLSLPYYTECSDKRVPQYLLAENCYVNTKDFSGTTALLIAVRKRNKRIIETLLASGADIMMLNNVNESPLHMVFQEHIFSPKMAKLFFLELCKKFSTCEDRAQSLIDARCHLYQACFFKSAEIIEYMLKHRVPIDYLHSPSKRSALHIAVSLEDIDSVKVLLKYGANVNARDSQGETPISYIYKYRLNHSYEKIEILKMLLNRKASPTSCDSSGVFQIGTILVYGNREAIHAVIQSNIDFTAKNQTSGRNVLHHLAHNPNPGIYKELQQYCNKYNLNVMSLDKSGMTPLHTSAVHTNFEMMQFLLDQGAIPNFTHTKYSYTPLYYCYAEFEPGYEQQLNQCVELLLQYGADPQFIVTNKNNKQITIFDAAKKTNAIGEMKPVIAHLVMLEGLGIPITNIISTKINSHPQLKKYFNRCKRLIKTKIFGSLTLFQLLITNEKTMARYSRNKKLMVKLTRLNHKQNLKLFCMYYYNILKKRILKGIQYSRFLDKISEVICKICEDRFDKNHLITDKIINFLDHESQHKLYKLSKEIKV